MEQPYKARQYRSPRNFQKLKVVLRKPGDDFTTALIWFPSQGGSVRARKRERESKGKVTVIGAKPRVDRGNELAANGHDRTLPFAEIGDYRCAHTYVHMYVCICAPACDNYYAMSLASLRFLLLAPPLSLNKTGYRREGHSTHDWYVVDEEKSALAVPLCLHPRVSLMLLILPRFFPLMTIRNSNVIKIRKRKEYHRLFPAHLPSALETKLEKNAISSKMNNSRIMSNCK